MDNPVITNIKGVGPARAKALHRLGIDTARDAVFYLPRDYRDLSRPDSVASIGHGDDVVLVAEVVVKAVVQRPKRNLTVVKAIVDDGTGRCVCVWYNQPWMEQTMRKGTRWVFFGRVEARYGEKSLQNPGFEACAEGPLPGILPIYPITETVSQKVLRSVIHDALELLGDLPDSLPAGLRLRHGLPEINEALQAIHHPAGLEQAELARRRLAFEELLLFLLLLRGLREERRREASAHPLRCAEDCLSQYMAALPFQLTGAQQRVLGEIMADLRTPLPMNRLVQGDVGSGKTALALAALYLAACDGAQGALMAPTEILANQHYESLRTTLAPLGVSVGLLTGSVKGKARREALESIRSGAWQVVCGTHALIENAVTFADLALVVTDEQHRFGVRQRSALQGKGGTPHMLVMSATPVPRTLALILYGDLDISIVDELPPGRQPPRTRIVPPDKHSDMYRYIRDEADKGVQTYIVCPLIEESDKLDASAAIELYNDLRDGLLRGVPMALVHGRMSAAEKDAALDAFRRNEARVLVSTTVIEVGVNIPNASIMVIENAERFGLAQLHQLRGRVGRGGQASWCFLLCAKAAPDSLARLKVMTETADGFRVAQADLENRGPGEFLGTRQSGLIDLHVMRSLKDVRLLSEVDAEVKGLDQPQREDERRALMQAARQRFEHRLEGIVFN